MFTFSLDAQDLQRRVATFGERTHVKRRAPTIVLCALPRNFDDFFRFGRRHILVRHRDTQCVLSGPLIQLKTIHVGPSPGLLAQTPAAAPDAAADQPVLQRGSVGRALSGQAFPACSTTRR